MPFGLFGRKPKTDLTLELDKETYRPGERIEARITVTCDKDARIEEACLQLVGVGTYKRIAGWGGSSGAGYGAIADPTPHTGVQEKTDLQCSGSTVVAQMPQAYKVALDIPSGIPPTHEGYFIDVEWLVSAICRVKRASAVVKEVKIALQPSPSRPVPEDKIKPISSSHDDCTLTLSLSKGVATSGESISGVLEVRPHKDFAASEVTVDLTSWEAMGLYEKAGSMHRCQHHTVNLAGQTDFAAGMSQRFPFDLTLPADSRPSMKSQCATRIWLVVGLLTRGSSFPYKVEQQFVVYTKTPAF